MPRKATGKQVRDRDGTVLSIHGKSANETGSVCPAKADGSWRATWRDTSGARRESRGGPLSTRPASHPRLQVTDFPRSSPIQLH